MHLSACPACDAGGSVTSFALQNYDVQRCVLCGLLFLNPQPSDDVLREVYSPSYSLGASDPDAVRMVTQIKRMTARTYLDQIVRYMGKGSATLLDVGCGGGELLAEADRLGFDVRGVDLSPHAAAAANGLVGRDVVVCSALEDAGLPDGSFDVCVCTDVIEHVRDPVGLLNHMHRVLKPGGVLLLVTPAVDSGIARWLRRFWFEFKIEHLHYFGRATIGNVLARTGFREVELSATRKVMTLEYVRRHFARFKVPTLSTLVTWVSGAVPKRLRGYAVTLPATSVTVLARARPRRRRPMLSVIVPAYNEVATIRGALDRVVAKEIPGLDKEVIIVESNSTDGTRGVVMSYQELPGIQVVLEERPRGKGHAVRQGLAHAAGDFVLIQDADDEYDINDYDALLEPLWRFQRAFVLGTRHKGHWRIRTFGASGSVSAYMNFGHILLTEFFNVLYGQTLSDPWTMYKVFRRDCLHRQQFECNRFDFDVELVAKLVRRGFSPLEIPVHYHSRTFSEGKKIRVLRDPITWIWACVKYRFTPLDSKPS
jgi:2-polyprenyl-3-methyl-5-hydroxy-6-metoxy-1,4-benzoquinol methylase